MSKISRKLVQIITAIGINSYFIGFVQGNIYRGSLKQICFPGLNCSSCPGALGSCPLALLQTSIAGITGSQITFFALGLLVLAGITLGRFICGWFCPFGLIQELIFKIPLPKVAVKNRFKQLEYLKYVVLLLFIVLLPALGTYGISSTAFCKYVCPVEVLEAYLPLMIVRPSIMSAIGPWLQWKFIFLITILLVSVFIFKPFCRFICPLGAIYSFFNPVSLYRLQVDHHKCTGCNSCQAQCKLDIAVYEDPNHRDCMRCNECLVCPSQALDVKHYGKEIKKELEL
ncbi:MAG: 4Fe-4S binding protein [Syntrophomonas sp.]